jgi:recombination protein RecA
MAAEEHKLDADRRKALNLAISQIEKQLGKGSIMRMGSESPRVRVSAIPTGAINLTPRSESVRSSRPNHRDYVPSLGKTTLTLHVAANGQRAGGVAATSMPSTRSTWSMRRSSGWMSRTPGLT